MRKKMVRLPLCCSKGQIRTMVKVIKTKEEYSVIRMDHFLKQCVFNPHPVYSNIKAIWASGTGATLHRLDLTQDLWNSFQI